MPKHCFVLLLCCATGLSLCAQVQTKQRPYRREFSMVTENDAYLLAMRDAYYTNGLFLRWNVADTFAGNKLVRGFELGQSIYTPSSFAVTRPSDIDRPYCGYLYGRYTQTRFSAQKEGLWQWSISAGVVGKASLGQALQEGYHKLFHYKRFEGWQYQIGNALGLDAAVGGAFTLFSLPGVMKLVPQFEASLGLHNTYLRVGSILVLGRFARNDQSALFQARVDRFRISPTEFFFYTQPQLCLQVYNATLQGGLLNTDPDAVTASPQTLVFQQRTGLCFAQHRFTAKLEWVFQTRETASQHTNQQYGGIGLAYRMF